MSAVILALMLALVLAVPPGEAACAWVLWQEHRRVGTSWQERAFFFEQAYTAREECEKHRGGAETVAANDNTTKAAGRIPDDRIRRFYQCVPDTIDPRGPKGSGR